jgi:hypothetical protein
MHVDATNIDCALSECLKMESKSSLTTTQSRMRMYSQIGFLITTNVHLILKLAAYPLSKEHLLCSRLNHLVYFVEPPANSQQNTTLIVIPNVLLSLWTEETRHDPTHADTTRYVLKSEDLDDALIANATILVVPDNLLHQNKHVLCRHEFNKLILCNSSNWKSIDTIKAQFYWFVHPSESQAHALNQIPTNWRDVLTIQCLPPLPIDYPVKEIYSEVPIENITLKGLVDEMMLDHLNSNDITRALQCISHKNVRTHSDVVHHVLRDFNETISHIDAKIYTVQLMEYACVEEKHKRLFALQKKRQDIHQKREELSNRLNKEENCFICFQNVSNPCIMKCCSKRSCFECIHTWFKQSRRCPMCNETKAEVFILHNKTFVPNEACDAFHPFMTKFENLFILLNQLKEHSAACVLICTSNVDQQHQIKSVVEKCTLDKLILKRNYKPESIRNGFFVVIQNISKYPFPVLKFKKITDVVFFDDRTFELSDVFAREHGQDTENLRIWRMRYITQSAYDALSRNA